MIRSACILSTCTHWSLIMESKLNEDASAGRGVKKKDVTLTLTKKVEVLQMPVIVWHI
jgi:hypothetical protein